MLKIYANPVIQEIHANWISDGVKLFLKREDLLHPYVSGNKWRKLHLNLEKAISLGAKTLVTFGGAFSNHIYATAAAAEEAGIESVGIIRGEETAVSNPTLQFAASRGMTFHFVDRKSYRDKTILQKELLHRWPHSYFLPEGGTNCLAIEGCVGIVNEEVAAMDVVAVPVGTGGTLAGILKAMPRETQVLGFSALKALFIQKDIETLLTSCNLEPVTSWSIITDAHVGGYGKINTQLIDFIREFKEEQGVLLDPIYTGKMMFHIKKMMSEKYFKPGSRVCAIHTGGLQGWGGMALRFGIDLRE